MWQMSRLVAVYSGPGVYAFDRRAIVMLLTLHVVLLLERQMTAALDVLLSRTAIFSSVGFSNPKQDYTRCL